MSLLSMLAACPAASSGKLETTKGCLASSFANPVRAFLPEQLQKFFSYRNFLAKEFF
jgi:hypothetical protein